MAPGARARSQASAIAARQAAPQDKEVPEMFQPGEFVVYGSSGVCRVVQVGALEGRAAGLQPEVLHPATPV